MTGTPVSIDFINFLVPEDGFDLGGVVVPHEVELLQGNPVATKANREMKTREMRANYKEIALMLPKALESWFRLGDEPDWKAVVGLYSSVVYNDALSLSQRFLMLAQALEVYHGATGQFQSKEALAADFKLRRDRILNLIANDEDKKWVNSKLHNYRTLAEKFKEMMEASPSAVRNLIDDIPAFCALIRETRNYYTHFGRELLEKKKVAQGAQLMKLTYEMCAVLEILLLNDLGISGTPLDRIVQKVKSLSFHEG